MMMKYDDDDEDDVDDDDSNDDNGVDEDAGNDEDDGDANCEQVIWETADLPVNLCLPAANHPPTEDTKYKLPVHTQIQI